MHQRERPSKILIAVGYVAMLVGALDPLEGSLLIVPGSALVALGTFLSQGERRWFAYRVWIFVAIACGVGALFGLSSVGGIGGASGHSAWWALLLLPYLAGWLLGIWGQGSPRWVQQGGGVVGLWYLALAAIVLLRAGAGRPHHLVAPLVLGACGLVMIGLCLWRLRRDASSPG